MCGISGLVNCGGSESLARMTSVQSHRGPDDSGLWERRFPDGTYVGLGSRRLAILDLSPDGHMPMCNEKTSNEDGSVWITYNGEIYNFADLRHELEAKGHSFRSHTDTESHHSPVRRVRCRMPEPLERNVRDLQSATLRRLVRPGYF
jgi:asparagine synthase (glutamine-hydrolysing)